MKQKQIFRPLWRYRIINRDIGCVLCQSGRELQVHHICGRKYSYQNLVTLCAECHYKVEKMIGVERERTNSILRKRTGAK